MLNFLYRFVTPWAISNKIQILKNRIIGKIANFLYPFYCKIKPLKFKKGTKVIVSLTTYPPRIKKIYLCLNSLMRQDFKDYKIILWLAKSQFDSLENLPKSLLYLNKKGLEIKFCDDLKSYKKIFYVAQEYKDHVIVTADDDTLYPENWLSRLYKKYEQNKNCITCYRAHQMTFDNQKKEILPYSMWNSLSKNINYPSYELVAIGVGGILYPKNTFDNVNMDFNIIKENAPYTDDIWLKVITVIKKMKVVKVEKNSKEWFTINSSQKVSLKSINVEKSNNNDIALKNLIKIYNLKFENFLDER